MQRGVGMKKLTKIFKEAEKKLCLHDFSYWYALKVSLRKEIINKFKEYQHSLVPKKSDCIGLRPREILDLMHKAIDEGK